MGTSHNHLSRDYNPTTALNAVFENQGQLTYAQSRNQLNGFGLTPDVYLSCTATWIAENYPQDGERVMKQRNQRPRINHADNLIEAASTLQQPFHWHTLAIAMWRKWPELYGVLGGEYPDTHKVSAMLAKKAAAVKSGAIVVLGDNMYRLG